MAHYHREKGTAVEVLAMGEDTTFMIGRSKKTVPTHEFTTLYRAGEPYEVEAGKFEYPEGHPLA